VRFDRDRPTFDIVADNTSRHADGADITCHTDGAGGPAAIGGTLDHGPA
jgi:hypothetical protein